MLEHWVLTVWCESVWLEVLTYGLKIQVLIAITTKKIALSLFFTIVIFVASQNAWKHSFIQTMFCDYLRDYIIVIWKISHADYFKEKLCVCFRQFMITYLKDWISFYITFSRLDLKIGIKSEKNEIPGSHTVWQQG